MPPILGLAVWTVTSLVPATGSTPPPFREYQSFGTRQQVGLVGRGTAEVGIEVAHSVRDDSKSTESLTAHQYRDRLIQSSNELRPSGVRRMQIDRLAPGDDGPRSKHQLLESRRTVTIELDGNRIEHQNQGIVGASTSRRVPAELDDPLVVDSDFVTGYQLLIDHALSRAKGVSALEGVTVTAIVPSKLGTYDFEFEVLGSESLKVKGGEQQFAKLRITRIEPPVGSLPPNASLDEHRLVWIASDGEVVRMDIPWQPRFKGESTTYNLRFRPDFYGCRSERLDIDGKPVLVSTREVRSTVDSTADVERRPAVLFVHDGSDASRAILASTCWNMTRRGLTFASLEVDPVRSEDMARAQKVIERLTRRPTVRKSRLFLITSGDALPREEPWDVSMFAAWAIVNGALGDRAALSSSLEAVDSPLLLLWGDEGPGLYARRDFAEETRAVVGSRASIVPLAQIDGSMRYVLGVPDATPKDDFGLAFGYVRGLERWLERMLD